MTGDPKTNQMSTELPTRMTRSTHIMMASTTQTLQLVTAVFQKKFFPKLTGQLGKFCDSERDKFLLIPRHPTD